jgi:uncharacterized protein (DUF983 family)
MIEMSYGTCPKCGSGNISRGVYELGGCSSKCRDCGHEWFEAEELC